MSNYYSPRKVVIGRHWKRPKPRVYECNIRDAERFYQQSYKDYLDAKEFAARRGTEPRIYAESKLYADDEPVSGWTMRRSNSVIDSLDERTNPREQRGGSIGLSNDAKISSSSYLDTTSRSTGPSKYSYGDDSSSYSLRTSSVTNQRGEGSQEGDLASIEQRLQRLRKLRDELGIPSESSRDVSFTSSTSRIGARQPSPTETRERRTRISDTSTSYSTAKAGSWSRATEDDTVRDKDDKSSVVERTSRFLRKHSADDDSYNRRSIDKSSRQNGKSVSFSAADDSDSYTYKSSTRPSNRSYDRNEDTSYGSTESSYRNSGTESKAYKSSSGSRYGGSSAATDDVVDQDDDELLSSIKKKFPTSEEILERIKKLDDEM